MPKNMDAGSHDHCYGRGYNESWTVEIPERSVSGFRAREQDGGENGAAFAPGKVVQTCVGNIFHLEKTFDMPMIWH